MTVGHCAIHLDGWGHYKLLSSSMVESWWRSGGRAPKNLHVMVPKSGSNIAQQKSAWTVMHFFMCFAVQSQRKIPKVQNFQFSCFLPEIKNVYVL